ncbi:MAG: radical SAM protein [Phycisphaerales bacterium]|nr:MAG: radical SAM protein [Phycisphaerales bacterium]
MLRKAGRFADGDGEVRDAFGRRINYLRISVTDRCNLRCYYCMPEGDVPLIQREDWLTFEEITEVARAAAGLGFDKIRLTGGEPLLRSNLVGLVAMLGRVRGLRDLSMTTNGLLLDKYALPLAEAGLHRVNISLDSVDPEVYREKTRGGDFKRAVKGIRAAQAAGFRRIKLNCVVEWSSEEPDAREVASFAERVGLEVRFIRRMNLAAGEFWVVDGGAGGDCARCNRLRLSCEGLVRPCLFSDVGFNVRELGARAALVQAIEAKPESGEQCVTSTFSQIGG